MKIPSLLTLVSIILISFSHIGLADVKLPNVIGSGMVLQRDMAVPVWGWAEAGEEVTVSFAGQTKKTKTGDDGKWTVSLDPLKANENGSALTITGKNKITLENVLVGEVWICSGQSNMEWAIRQSMNPKEEAAAANYPQIRLFNVPGHTVSPLPKDEGAGQWQVCDPNSANNLGFLKAIITSLSGGRGVSNGTQSTPSTLD